MLTRVLVAKEGCGSRFPNTSVSAWSTCVHRSTMPNCVRQVLVATRRHAIKGTWFGQITSHIVVLAGGKSLPSFQQQGSLQDKPSQCLAFLVQGDHGRLLRRWIPREQVPTCGSLIINWQWVSLESLTRSLSLSGLHRTISSTRRFHSRSVTLRLERSESFAPRQGTKARDLGLAAKLHLLVAINALCPWSTNKFAGPF